MVLLKSLDAEKPGRQNPCSIMISIMHCYLEAFIPPKIFSGQPLLLARACKTQEQKSPVQAAWYIKHTDCTTSKPETDEALKQEAGKQYFARLERSRNLAIKRVFNSAELYHQFIVTIRICKVNKFRNADKIHC